MFLKKRKLKVIDCNNDNKKEKNIKKKKTKKPLSKNMQFAIRSLFFLAVAGLLLACISYVIIMDEKAIKPTTSYEEANDMEIIDVGHKVESYYEKKENWSLDKSFEGFTGVNTLAKVTVLDDDEKEKNVNYSVDVYGDGDNRRIIMENDDSFEVRYIADVRLIDSNLYVLCQGKKGDMTSKAYVHSKYDEKKFNLSSFTSAYDFVSLIINEKKDNYEVIYNCRTKKDNKEYDDLTIYFEEYDNTFQLLVSPKTGKAEYIITPLLSDDDITAISYDSSDDTKVCDFTKKDVEKAERFSKSFKKVKLPNGTKGSSIEIPDMITVLSNISGVSSYGGLKFTSYDSNIIKDKNNNDDKNETKESKGDDDKNGKRK